MASSTSGLQPVKFLQPFIQRFAMSATHCHYLSLKIYLFTWIHNTCFFVWEINSKWWMLIQLSRMYNCSEFCDRDLFNFFFISQTTGTNWLVKANVISSSSRVLRRIKILKMHFWGFFAEKCAISDPWATENWNVLTHWATGFQKFFPALLMVVNLSHWFSKLDVLSVTCH